MIAISRATNTSSMNAVFLQILMPAYQYIQSIHPLLNSEVHQSFQSSLAVLRSSIIFGTSIFTSNGAPDFLNVIPRSPSTTTAISIPNPRHRGLLFALPLSASHQTSLFDESSFDPSYPDRHCYVLVVAMRRGINY
ncbi:hypothetical protein L5515_017273 [Caenorhabditis briggsae]|uniref:Uncharacterized protein n=1 Tax=Caenorhabditis briggsae TaxID=6238 RepID=A0AAE9FDT3_CAEBR|nr:hypothetical protein L5515_017273 [Caenorhabditis briggsae]